VADILDLRGVSPLISVTRHATTLTCDCLAEDVETVLETVCDMLRAPQCVDQEIDRCRGQLLTQLRQDENSPSTRAIEAVMPLLYGADHPYGRAPKGSAATVEGIDRRQLLDFHAAWFAPDRLTLVLVGDIGVSGAVAVVTRVCGDWGGRAMPVLPLRPPPVPTRRRLVIPMPAKAQADIVYGFTTILRSDPAFHAYWIMNNVLGNTASVGDSVGGSASGRGWPTMPAACSRQATLPGRSWFGRGSTPTTSTGRSPRSTPRWPRWRGTA
jgi:predicted Zn-dependent peptidase